MTERMQINRPARAAIAAVLAFSATPLLAQVAAVPPVAPTMTVPTESAPPSVAPPTVAPAPAFAPTQPVVQATPSVDERREAAIAASQAEAAQAKPRPLPRPVARTAPRSAVASQPATQPVAPVRPAPVEASAPTMMPVPPAAKPAAPVAQASPAAVAEAAPQAAARTDSALLWAMGGSALLLAGLAGAALMRRRPYADERVADAAVIDADMAAAPLYEPTNRAPMPAPTAAAEEQAVAAPVAARAAPADTLDAMVAAPPSPDNPFVTHRNRVRRAKFLLAQREAVANPAAAPAPIAARDQAPPVDRSQTVYRFGTDRARPGLFKPRTS